VVEREASLDNLHNKESGWVNPLSIADNGDDDDEVLNMEFKSLGQRRHWKPPAW